MKHKYLTFIVTLTALLFCCSSCSYDNDKYFSRLPRKIADFITDYYPNPTVDTYTDSTDGYYVGLKSGPGFYFNTNCDWTAVDGFGLTLPAMFVFDQFPEPLYDYLEATENTENVFAAKRTSLSYTVRLLDSTITYDIASTAITTSF